MTTLFGNAAVPVVPSVAREAVPVYKKHAWLPLLTVLFLFSYGLMTMLIVEQGQTIESQRALIKDMLRDSTELSAVKGKAVMEKNLADAKRRAQTQAQSLSNQTPSTQMTPSTQAPSNAPSSQTPASQQHRIQSKGGKNASASTSAASRR